MDYVLGFTDNLFFDYLYAKALPLDLAPAHNVTEFMDKLIHPIEIDPLSQLLGLTPSANAFLSQLARDDLRRQTLSLFFITWVFGFLVYFICATLSYVFVFDKRTFDHPKFLKDQIKLEILQTLWSLPGMAVCTTPFFLAEVLGYSKLYSDLADMPMWYNIFQFPLFIVFTDFFIYLIHRGLHHPSIYKHLHKAHHRWIMPTPYASHAFHPLDGFSQSLPYHVFPFIFPLHKIAYLCLFAFINIWTVFIHDGEYIANSPIINGAACHTMHHLYFRFNYGQFTTLWDRLGGTYRVPDAELFDKEKKMAEEEWKKQVEEMEQVVKEVEGSDEGFREYLHQTKAKKDL